MWADDYYALYEEKQAEIRKLQESFRRSEDKQWETENKYKDEIDKLKNEHMEKDYENECIIRELKNKLAHFCSVIFHEKTVNSNGESGGLGCLLYRVLFVKEIYGMIFMFVGNAISSGGFLYG